MTKNRIGFAAAGALCAALLCGTGAVQAQDLYGYDNDGQSINSNETVTVHPYGTVHSRMQLPGRSGSLYSEEFSLSRPVNYSDLDLSRTADARELRSRINATAHDICFELAVAGNPAMKDSDADNQCIRTAIRDAMRQVPGGLG